MYDFCEHSDIDPAVKGGYFARLSLNVDEDTRTLLSFDFVNLDGPVQLPLREIIEREGVEIYAPAGAAALRFMKRRLLSGRSFAIRMGSG